MRDALAAAAWLNTVMMLLGLCLLAVPALAPAIALDLGVSTELIGMYSALMWSASVVTSVCAGSMIRRYGAMRVSQACLAVGAFGMLLGSAGSLVFLALSAVFIGLGQGAETPASSSLLVRITPIPHRTVVLSIKQTGGQIGGMLAGLLFPALAGFIGWRGALFVMAVPMIALVLVIELPRHKLDPPSKPLAHASHLEFPQAVRLIVSDGRLRSLSISCMLYVAVQVCQQAFLVSYLVAECLLSLRAAGMLLALAQVGGLFGRIFWGALAGHNAGKSGAIATLIATGAGMALCAFALGVWGSVLSLPVLGTLCFCFGTTSAGWVGVHIAETARMVPAEAVGQVTGAMLVTGVAGLILGPLSFAALAAATSFGSAYCVSGLVAVLGALSLAFPFSTRKRPFGSAP